jgi:transposase
MARELVPDRLWEEIKPLIPPDPLQPKGGRPRVDSRKCFTGIVFVLWTGCPWNAVPAEMGCGSGPTLWRRFRDWTQAGVWDALWGKALVHLRAAGLLRMDRAVVDSASVRAALGGRTRARIRPIAPSLAASATS